MQGVATLFQKQSQGVLRLISHTPIFRLRTDVGAIRHTRENAEPSLFLNGC